jgi:predicted ribonuclease YlaK
MLLETNSKILNGHIDEAQLIRFEKKLNKKRNKQQRYEEINKNHLNLKKINPLTENQRLAFKSWNSGLNLMLHGLAGTGKSYVSLYLALKEILSNESQYKNIVIVRSAVPTRDIGFLPGSVKDKTKIYDWISCLVKDKIYFGPFPNQLMIDTLIEEKFDLIINLRLFFS